MLLLALGSRGDVQPQAVLAGALRRRGLDARVLAVREYAALVEEQGAGFVPVDATLAAAIESTRTPLGRLVVRSPLGQARLLRRWSEVLARPVADAVLSAIRPGEGVLTGLLSRDVATALAEADGRRAATVVFTGQLPTRRPESHFFYHYFTRWAAYNRWGVRFNWRYASNVGAPMGRELRRRLGLRAPASARRATDAADRHPVLVAASPTLVPPAPDWPAGVHQTGYLAPPAAPFEPDADLAAFLTEPPVYVGFGSMTGSSGHESLTVLAEAARRSGRRIVTPVLPGGRPGPAGGGVLTIGSVPFGWLFARCAAIVHHGGAGTTHEGLRAGVPSVAVPFGVDQPYHAWRLQRLGVGPAPVPIGRLDAPRLADLLRDLTDGPASAGYRLRAAEVGERVRAEDGVGATIALLDRLGFS